MTGPDAQRPELVEREDTIGKPGHHFLDPVQLGVLGRVARLLPGPGALKGDVVGVQDPPHPFPADPHDPVRHLCRVGAAVAAAEVVRELADAPVRERQTQLPRASAGDLDHERLVLVGDPRGAPGAPVRLQHGQPVGVERVDHVPDRVRVSGDQPGDRQDRCPRRGRQDDQPPAVPDGVGTTPAAYQAQQELAFIVGQSTCPDRSGHDPPRSTPTRSRVHRPSPQITHR